MNYLDYSNAVSNVMQMLSAKGFKTNAWTEECSGEINGKQTFVTFYPSDDNFILVYMEGKEGKYVSQAELIGMLNFNN